MLLTTEVPNPKLAQRFILWLCQELQVFPDSISVYGEDVIDGNINGLCIDISDTEYVILVKTAERDIGQVFCTIAHEMVHVKQYMKENLGQHLDNCQHIPYRERWWEVEAFSKSVALVEKFARGLK